MEELNDDGLQDLLSNSPISCENTLNEKDTGDLLAYQNLFKALDTEPVQGLSFNFASNVRRKIQERLNRKSDRQFNIMVTSLGNMLILWTFADKPAAYRKGLLTVYSS